MKLIIVESPGKIKKIRSFLGPGWDVKASIGHIRDLPTHEFGMEFQEQRVMMHYVNSEQKQKTIQELKKAADRSSEIYLAMDMDREGEAIAWHVGLSLGKEHWPKIKRIAFNEITKTAVLSAIEKPRRVDVNLVNAQQARRAVDRIVGFKVSPMVWAAKNAGTSAGRVQSVAVRLVIEREREIRSFTAKEYWKIKAHCFVSKLTPDDACISELVFLDGRIDSIDRAWQGSETVHHRNRASSDRACARVYRWALDCI